MSLEVGVLTFFMLMILIGLALIFMSEDNTDKKPGYRLKVCTTHLNLAKLKYSKNYGLTWKSIPLGITGKYEPRFYYCVKLEDETSVNYIMTLFESYLNDYHLLKYYLYKSKIDLNKAVEIYRAEQLTKLTKSSTA